MVVTLKDGRTEIPLCLPIIHPLIQKRNTKLSHFFVSENYQRRQAEYAFTARELGFIYPRPQVPRAFMNVAIHILLLKTPC